MGEPTAEFRGVPEPDILERIENGESIAQIAEDFGCNRSVLWRWLEADEQRSARARASRAVSAAAYDEQALQGIEGAKDGFELSRAKEVAHHLRWRASKIAPRDYGDKVQIGGDPTGAPLKTESTLTITAEEAYKRMLNGG